MNIENMSAEDKKVQNTKLLLVDGNSLLFRAFYALPLLKTKAGVYTNGVYGFLTMYNRIMEQEQPTHILVAFDKSRRSFRNDIYPEYKGHRSSPPEELIGQFALLREVLTKMAIAWLEIDGFEADDIIGSYSAMSHNEQIECIIVTGDNDSLQLVSPFVTVLMTKKGITTVDRYTPHEVKEKWGVEPEGMIDIKALMGDTSDNIPGVPGIGPKTAMKLLSDYHSVGNLYDNLEQISNKNLRAKLLEYKEQALLSYKLATIDKEMELPLALDKLKRMEPDYEELKNSFLELEFNSLVNKLKPQKKFEIEFLDTFEEQEVILLASITDIQHFCKSCQDQAIGIFLDFNKIHPMWSCPNAAYIELQEKLHKIDLNENDPEIWRTLKIMLEDPGVKKYTHNAKALQVLLLRKGIDLKGIAGDSLLLAYVNDPALNGDDLLVLLNHYLSIDIPKTNTAQAVQFMRELHEHIDDLNGEDQKKLYIEVELPLSAVLAKMEFIGIRADREELANLSAVMEEKISHSQKDIFEIAGKNFNINSTRQLGEVLFDDLGLRKVKKTKTGYSTGAEVLEQLYDDHEIIKYIIDYRQISKLKSTYADALQAMINPETGRIHTIFKQAQTATGRLSSIEPNLQNIPIRTEEGRKIRSTFKALPNSSVFLSADYSQIDLRALAHISQDEVLIETFQAGIDIHTRTAAEIFNIPLDQVNAEYRRRAKAVNFGIIYGISDFGLARDTGVKRNEAKKYIENYLNSYPGVQNYMDDIVKFAKKNGYVETILKRRRYLPDINERNKTVQAFAQRMALNTPIQGSSADIIKLAMLSIDESLREAKLNTKMLLQVHDDLLFEVPLEELNLVAPIIKEEMENACKLLVPLEVNIKVGPNWNDMHDWNSI